MERLIGQAATAERASRAASVWLQFLLLVLVCVYLGNLASAGAVGTQVLALLALAGVAAALVAPPHLLVAIVLLVLGSFSLSQQHPLAFGGTTLYSLDLLLALVVLRAVLPRDRVPPPARLDRAARVLFGLWALVMIWAGARSVLGGADLVSVIRLETPLVYAVGFYAGLGRIIREREFQLDKAIRYSVAVAIGLVGWMAIARLTNNPFETEDTVGRLGEVITTSGTFRRDFGFASAFIVFPVLALAATAYLLHGPRRTWVAATVATVGIVATLVTLIRGEIFGLFVGLAVIVVLSSREALRRTVRTRALMAAFAGIVVGAVALWIVDPSLARAIVERSLPGIVEQSETASATAEYRVRALDAGLGSAERDPLGVGLLPAEDLVRTGISPGYVGHSSATAMLVYAGWIGLVAAALAIAALARASFTAARPVPWLHPLYVGSLILFVVYGFGAAGLVGQAWVVVLAALIAALRFNAGGAQE